METQEIVVSAFAAIAGVLFAGLIGFAAGFYIGKTERRIKRLTDRNYHG